MPVRVLELSAPTFTGLEPLQFVRLKALQGRVLRIQSFDEIGFAEIELCYWKGPRDLRGHALSPRNWTVRGAVDIQTWNLDPLDLLAVPSVRESI